MFQKVFECLRQRVAIVLSPFYAECERFKLQKHISKYTHLHIQTVYFSVLTFRVCIRDRFYACHSFSHLFVWNNCPINRSTVGTLQPQLLAHRHFECLWLKCLSPNTFPLETHGFKVGNIFENWHNGRGITGSNALFSRTCAVFKS